MTLVIRAMAKGNGVNRLFIAALLGAVLPLAVGGGASAQQTQVSAAASNPLAAQSLEGLAATRERPLFSAQRRPPAPARFVPPPPPPPPAPLQPPQVAVYGIIAEPNGARAMIRANGDKIIGVRVGDDIAGWKVTKIERRTVELSLADRAVSFAMFSTNSATANAANSATANAPTGDEDTDEDDSEGYASPRKNRKPRN